MTLLPSFFVGGLTTLPEALSATEQQVRALATEVRQHDRLTTEDREVLVKNVLWLKTFYAQVEAICLKA